jgi:hypothetical protein
MIYTLSELSEAVIRLSKRVDELEEREALVRTSYLADTTYKKPVKQVKKVQK